MLCFAVPIGNVGKHTEGALEVLGGGVTEKDISDSLF